MRVLALIALCLPFQARALSCLPHAIEATFQEAEASEAAFVIVQGRLDFDAGALPQTDLANQNATPPMTSIDAELLGMALGASGFDVPYDQPVTLVVACYGPWCASAQEGGDVLAFVERRPGARDVVTVTPCGGYLFATPTPAMIDAVRQCFNGGACEITR
ncbi:hypothetical protein [uncultured Sulfitobacter sp.]|uniref:hypothetical protein n=1 Tax=uncultured Sulfitobacter sp. TaxID=191468 RepID=UPI00261AA309|nr:hypothetical protein [uncultured Sulfitobacter sp.]